MLNTKLPIPVFHHAAVVLASLLVFSCGFPRISMISDRRFAARPSDAEIECFVGKLDRSYEPIAVVDSDRYVLLEYGREDMTESARAHNEDQKRRMLEDLKKLARKLGGDAVHNIRLLAVEVQGMVLDENVPVPGAVRQGVSYRYFLRGEVVHLPTQVPLPSGDIPASGMFEQAIPVDSENSEGASQLDPDTARRQPAMETDQESINTDLMMDGGPETGFGEE